MGLIKWDYLGNKSWPGRQRYTDIQDAGTLDITAQNFLQQEF